MLQSKRLDYQKKIIERQRDTIKELNVEIANLECDKRNLQARMEENESALRDVIDDLQKIRKDYLDVFSQMNELRENYKNTLLEIDKERAMYRNKVRGLLNSLQKGTK